MCVCVCVWVGGCGCVCEWERKRKRNKMRDLQVISSATNYIKYWILQLQRYNFHIEKYNYKDIIFNHCHIILLKEGNVLFNHILSKFIYSYMASSKGALIATTKQESRCCHFMGYSFQLTARGLLYAPSHRQDSTCHDLIITNVMEHWLEWEVAGWVHYCYWC